MKLEVHQHLRDDVYHDRVRIPQAHRGKIREGRVCRLKTRGRSILVEVRGLVSETRPVVRMGDKERIALGVDLFKTYDFTLREVGWLGQFTWAWNTSDSASRIAARLGLLGLFLGLLGLAAGLLPLVAH